MSTLVVVPLAVSQVVLDGEALWMRNGSSALR